MTINEFLKQATAGEAGERMHAMIADLYPICRSITGDGIRETLRRVAERVPLETVEVPTGTAVLDWTVPKEWNIRDAWVKDAQGNRVIDFNESNLHVLNYSVPVHETLSLEELRERVATLPEHPEWIPYRTSYYRENWGFCASHKLMESLPPGDYDVCIDSTLEDGSLTYGELVLEGEQPDEVLVSTHACHPSMCNDNLSGVALATLLAETLGRVKHRYTYRFLFIPGTIGAITWLARNESRVDRIRHGLVITGVGDRGGMTYKRSRRGSAEIDRAAAHVLDASGGEDRIIDFHPYGYDERQYCSPGFDLPVGRLSRSPYGEYPEYHTSADDLDFVAPEALEDSFHKVLRILDVIERNRTFRNTHPKGEPQLGKRGLYDSVGERQLAMLWVLNQSDGSNSLLDIAERAGIDFALVADVSGQLRAGGLLDET